MNAWPLAGELPDHIGAGLARRSRPQVAGGPPALLAQAGPIVDSVAIETHDIFDSTEARASFLFGLANALHVTTQPWVVRREVLIRAGAPLDERLVAETARNLRSLGLFRRVVIDTVRANGRLVARVVTYDGWTTTLETALSSTGHVVTWSAGLTERNLLGTGNLVGASYRKEVDRRAWRFRGQANRALGTRVVGAGYAPGGGDGVAEAARGAAAAGSETVLFEQMWRSRHAIAHQALLTAGKLHPDKKIAKAARAALVKANSVRNSARSG